MIPALVLVGKNIRNAVGLLLIDFNYNANPWVNPTARACTFLRLRWLLSDALSVGFMVALAAGYPCRWA